ncbi:hypothetical protein GmRootV15_04600 [Variovorax sp. V15]
MLPTDDSPLLLVEAEVRWRVPPAVAATLGNSSARCTPYCARAFSMFCSATRMSRLLANASSMVRRRRSSVMKPCQPVLAETTPGLLASLAFASAAAGHFEGTGASGRE